MSRKTFSALLVISVIPFAKLSFADQSDESGQSSYEHGPLSEESRALLDESRPLSTEFEQSAEESEPSSGPLQELALTKEAYDRIMNSPAANDRQESRRTFFTTSHTTFRTTSRPWFFERTTPRRKNIDKKMSLATWTAKGRGIAKEEAEEGGKSNGRGGVQGLKGVRKGVRLAKRTLGRR